MFGKTKKNAEGKKQAPSAAKIKEDQDIELDKEIDREIAIYTMPEKFRLDSKLLSKSKITGVIIMVAGFVFIVALIFLVYWFSFRTKSIEDSPLLDQGKNQTEFIPPIVKEPTDNVLEDDSDDSFPPPIANLDQIDLATSTDEIIEPIATSTPEVEINEMDSDNDGLTNKEEILLGSNINEIDSDNDSYLDLSELQNGYNPAGAGGLVDNAGISKYVNIDFNYSLLYPVDWIRNAIGGNDSIMFRSEDNSFIQIIVQPNVNQEQITDWYKRQFAVDTITTEMIIVNENWQGVKNEDGTIIYLTDNERNYIFVLSYNPGVDEVFYYTNIFSAMIDSFTIGLLASE